MLSILLACGVTNVDLPDTDTDTDTDTDSDSDSDTDSDSDSDSDTDSDSDSDSDTDADAGPTDTECHTIGWTGTDLVLMEVDMATGVWTEDLRVALDEDPFHEGGTYGLATDGAVWVFPAQFGDGTVYWAVLDPAAGTVLWSAAAPSAMIGYTGVGYTGSEWVAFTGDYYPTFGYYATFDALVSSTPSRTVASGATTVLDMSASGDQIFASWFTGGTVSIMEGGTGELERQITVEGYDDYLYGLSGGGGKVHVLSPAARDQHVYSFDALTGASLEAAPVPTLDGREVSFYGLWCVTTP